MDDYLPISEYYLYCAACRTYFDRWKHGSLEDTGHAKCRGLRTLYRDEFLSMLEGDKDEGCLNEMFHSHVIEARQGTLQELTNVLSSKRPYQVRRD